MTEIELRKILNSKTIGIAGCGGLGSNCAIALARIGVGKLVIADFDRVEISNLNRQYFFRDQIGMFKVDALVQNIHRIDEKVNVDSFSIKLDVSSIIEIYSSVDILVEAFDKKEMKQMLIETHLKHFGNKPLIVGNGMAGIGDNNLIHTRNMDNIYICGDEINEIGIDNPPLAPKVGIVANMQANQVLELILKSIN